MQREENRSQRHWWMRLLGLGALALALIAPAPASAEVTHFVPNLPTLLPPNPSTPSGTVYPGFDVCADGASTCPDDVIAEMYRRWTPLDASCDHNAVFALTYLRTTEEFRRTVHNDPSFFSDLPWIDHEDAIFADFYFRAWDNWFGGNQGAVPGAWQVAFDAADSPNVTGAGDMLLGMNAHINRDLAYTLAAVGLLKPDLSSRKPDHDKVNYFLENIADPLQIELDARYDPIFSETDAEPSPLDEEGVLLAVRLFRENAWRYAEQLIAATTDEQRQQVSAAIEAQSTAYAEMILAANTIPGYTSIRDARCAAYQAAHPPSAPGTAAGTAPASGPGTGVTVASSKCKRRHRRAGHRKRHCRRRLSAPSH